MVIYLLDTNVMSESSRPNSANANVLLWMATTPAEQTLVSVLSIGEVRQGVEKLRRKHPDRAQLLEVWLNDTRARLIDRVVPVDEPVAQLWGRLSSGRSVPIIDTYLAATALVHGLTVATRNTKDFAWTGVPTFDPFVG